MKLFILLGPLLTFAICMMSCADEVLTTCGDGKLDQPIEVCDHGFDNGTYGYCTTDCSGMGPHCGDGNIDSPNEVCDDGENNGSYNHCKSDCSNLGSFCGDGNIDSFHEACDDGGEGGIYNHCKTDCSGMGPHCGDGTIDASNEICDDGPNNGTYDYCKMDCSGRGPFCGDGSLDAPHEICDQGSNNSDTGCGGCLRNCQGIVANCLRKCLVKQIQIQEERLVARAHCDGQSREFRFHEEESQLNSTTLATQSIILTAMSHGYSVNFYELQDTGAYYRFSQVEVVRDGF